MSTYRQQLTQTWQARHGLARRGGETSATANRLRITERPAPERAKLGPRQRLQRDLFEQVLENVESEGWSGLGGGPAMKVRLGRLLDEGLRNADLAGLSSGDRDRLEAALMAELTGFGPVQPLVEDPTVSDILVNGPHEVWVDRFGRLEKTPVRFNDDDHLLRLLNRMVASHGRTLEEANPYVDARLPDGSRLHAMVPPLSSRGPVFAIRRSRAIPLRLDQLCSAGTLSEQMAQFLAAAVAGGASILVSGGAAAGKTTLLNVLSQFIPSGERVVTIEETAELSLEHPHVIPLEARMANIEGRGEITLRTLVKNALRLRADRIIVGEVRGSEVFDMLQAMNVGHNGSMTTVHSNSPEDAVRRLETLVLLGGFELPGVAVRQLLGAAFHLIVQITRFADGSRRITRVCEVVPHEDEVETVDLFEFVEDQSGEAGEGRGTHRTTGHRPGWISRLRLSAEERDALFQPGPIGNPGPEAQSGGGGAA